MARGLGGILKVFQRLRSVSHMKTVLKQPSATVSERTSIARSLAALQIPFLSKPRDLSLPNSSWGTDMMRLYEHYNSQCEEETADGKKQAGLWKRIPSYNRIIKFAIGGVYLSKLIQSKARLFTRNMKEPGAAFEYVLFENSQEKTCVGIFQNGHLLEGPPGHVHGGAIATMIDTVTGTHATLLSGPVMTANLNISYRSPIPLGSTVLLESRLDKKEGRKTLLSCKVTSPDGSKVHTETSALFLSISISHLLKGG